MTDVLMREIERVIFEAHPLADRDGAVDFDELLEIRATRFREARAREEDALASLSERIGTELEKQTLIDTLKKHIVEKTKLVAGYTTDRSRLVAKGSGVRVTRLGALTAAAEKVRGYLRLLIAQEQSLLALGDEVENFRKHQAPETLRRTQEKYKPSGLKPDAWANFLLDYKGEVGSSLTEYLARSRENA